MPTDHVITRPSPDDGTTFQLRDYFSSLLGAAIRFDWIRRTRVDGDDWTAPDVPLGEDSESYLLRVISNTTVLREEVLATPSWTYDLAAQRADGVAPGDRVEVAQLSARYGAGLSSGLELV